MRIQNVHTDDAGATLVTSTGRIRLQRISPTIIRTTYTTRSTFGTRPSLGILAQHPVAPALTEADGRLTASTGLLTATIDTASGAFSWHTADGALLFREPHDGADTKILDEVDVVLTHFDHDAQRTSVQSVDGMKTHAEGGQQSVDRRAYATTLRLEFATGEAVYGLGQHEDGILNYRGHSQDLYPQNMKVAVPVIVSTRGYAILWDSYSVARFDDGPDGATFRTAVDDELDFYVILGPEFDDIIAGIRSLTGRVPMLPRWTLGYLQSKERYADGQELLDVVGEFRRRHIPIDGIVQDWKTWPGDLWGQKSFDPQRYPNPDGLCQRLHAADVRLMVSIWPNMHNDGPDQVEMRERGFLLGDGSTYDARRPDARALYWQQTEHGYFRHGVDAWWADCTEPFEADWKGAVKPGRAERLALNVGTATTFLDPEDVNAYSLLHSQGLYEGQRAADGSKRVVVLTRSASLGQQRTGAVTWSGDISATWTTLRRQIADGLNFCLTGNPRWSFDIGAFFVGRKDELWFWDGDFDAGVNDLGYRELYVRWLQAGTFLPMMRSHGTETPREPWRFGDEGDDAYDTIVDFIRLRYRLLPYLYALHSHEWRHNYTSMRTLAFDFRHDPGCYDIDDQFMLGPAIMVCPVTEPMFFGPGSRPIRDSPTTRRVYLPAGTHWYDFWTGRRHAGGQLIDAEAPLHILPLFVRAGSILPLGPQVEHSGASASGPLEIRVYPGADGSFEFYDDEGDGYRYEAEECALTTMRWDDNSSTLFLSPRVGQFSTMAPTTSVHVVPVNVGHGVGHNVCSGIAAQMGPRAVAITIPHPKG